MALQRNIVGGLASVLLHAGLLWWGLAHAPAPTEPEPRVELELIEVTPLEREPLAARATAASPGATAPSPAPGEAANPMMTARPREPAPRKPATQQPAAPLAPEAAPASDEATPTPEPPPESPAPPHTAGETGAAGTPEGRGTSGDGGGRSGIGDEGPDHAAYGAELVRLVKAEIDVDPVPGLGPRDSIEVVLEVLPSGRLARRGLGKYDYAQVVHSTLGPLRLHAILRRILRASQGFPPHPSSFPRQRYVVGFTVRFRERHG